MPKRSATKARLGRPPDTDPAVTRRRILDVAQAMFAERGYESTTNRLLGAEADLTAGAIYHHFGTKADLYIAVYDDAIGLVNERFSAAIAEQATFRGKLESLLDEAHEMNVENPMLARFLGAFRVDIERNPQLAETLSETETGGRHFVENLVDVGIATGELDRGDRATVIALLRAFLVGLTDAVSSDRVQHRHAVNGMKKLIDGRLLRPVSVPKTRRKA